MSSASVGRTEKAHGNREDWNNLKKMLPFVWSYKGRVILALGCLVISKLAMVGIPIILKYIVDSLDTDNGQIAVLPIIFISIYGVLRFLNSGFNELRDAVFARVRYHAMNSLSVTTLTHLHNLSQNLALRELKDRKIIVRPAVPVPTYWCDR